MLLSTCYKSQLPKNFASFLKISIQTSWLINIVAMYAFKNPFSLLKAPTYLLITLPSSTSW